MRNTQAGKYEKGLRTVKEEAQNGMRKGIRRYEKRLSMVREQAEDSMRKEAERMLEEVEKEIGLGRGQYG